MLKEYAKIAFIKNRGINFYFLFTCSFKILNFTGVV